MLGGKADFRRIVINDIVGVLPTLERFAVKSDLFTSRQGDDKSFAMGALQPVWPLFTIQTINLLSGVLTIAESDGGSSMDSIVVGFTLHAFDGTFESCKIISLAVHIDIPDLKRSEGILHLNQHPVKFIESPRIPNGLQGGGSVSKHSLDRGILVQFSVNLDVHGGLQTEGRVGGYLNAPVEAAPGPQGIVGRGYWRLTGEPGCGTVTAKLINRIAQFYLTGKSEGISLQDNQE